MKKRQDRPMNPQRLAFKENYCNPESETFGSIKESAKKAGFSESYSAALMSESTDNAWVKEIIKDYKLISQAEKNLEVFLTEEPDQKIKADITKFVLSRLYKQKYSERTEHTGADGEDLIPNELVIKKIDDTLDNYLGNGREKTN